MSITVRAFVGEQVAPDTPTLQRSFAALLTFFGANSAPPGNTPSEHCTAVDITNALRRVSETVARSGEESIGLVFVPHETSLGDNSPTVETIKASVRLWSSRGPGGWLIAILQPVYGLCCSAWISKCTDQ